jgi:hypothetical protein
LGTAYTADFIAADSALGVVGTFPGSGTTAQSFRLGTPGGTPLQVHYQVPIDPATVNTTNVKLTANGQAVTIAPVVGGANGQTVKVYLDPSAGPRLLPSTNYELTVSGLKAAAVPDVSAGKTLSPADVTFTTISFGVSKIYDYIAENLNVNDDQGNWAGVTGCVFFTPAVACAPIGAAASNQDRSVTVSANELQNNRLTVQFNNTPSNVSADTLQLFEAGANNALTQVPTTITKVTDADHTRSYVITANSSYAVKYGQRYVVKALTAITDPNGANLKLEGCAGSGDACAEVRSFNTAPLTPALGFHKIHETRGAPHPPDPGGVPSRTDPTATTVGLFDINFNYKVDPATLNLPTSDADLAKPIKLFKTQADGTLKQVGIACSIASTTQVQCQATAALDRNTPYTLNVAYTTDAPLAVPASYTTGSGSTINDPSTPQTLTITADTASGRFSGVRTLSFTSHCP